MEMTVGKNTEKFESQEKGKSDSEKKERMEDG